MPTSPKARALEVCMQQIQAGANLEQALSPYPQWADELRPRLEAAQAARAYGAAIQVPAEGINRSRIIFLQAANQHIQTHSGLFAIPTWRWVLGVLVLALVFFLSIRTVAVTAQALPGDPLYRFKIAAEQAHLLLAANPAQRLDLEQSYDQQRAAEVEALIQRSRSAGQTASPQVSFTGALTRMKPDGWMVGAIPVQITSETQFTGEIQPGYFLEVQGILKPGGPVQAQKIRARGFDITGRVEAMNGEQWVVGGVSLQVNARSLIQGQPALGSLARVRAIQVQDSNGQAILWARLVEIGPVVQSPLEIPGSSQAPFSTPAGSGQSFHASPTAAEAPGTISPQVRSFPPQPGSSTENQGFQPLQTATEHIQEDIQTSVPHSPEPAGTPERHELNPSPQSPETAEPAHTNEPDEHSSQPTAIPTETQS